MQKHQDALLMRGTRMQTTEVAVRAIVRRVTTTTDKTAMGVRCVLASIALTITIRARKAISLAKVISRGRVVTSLVLAIIVKAVMGREEVAISPVPVTIVKEAINLAKVVMGREKVAISPVLATIVKVAINNAPKGGPRPRRTADYNPHAKYSMKKQIEYKETHIDPDEPIRLNKYLANAGVCSRREADEFIQAGVVKVNGEIVTELGTKVKRSDEVHFHDQLVSIEKKVYILLNKPKDYVTTSDDPQNRKTVMDLVKGACRERIYPVGRLDRNTTGVLLLTNDGELATKLTHPGFMKKKIYHVYLDKNVTAADMKQIADGIELEDGEIHADAIEYASETDRKQVGIEIHSGRNRIVRRIFEHLGYKVIRLDRVYFAGLTKKNVRRGDWRFLTEKEVDMLHMGAFE